MIRRRTLLGRLPPRTLAAPAILRAQTVSKLTFYYPIAVGGPIPADHRRLLPGLRQGRPASR